MNQNLKLVGRNRILVVNDETDESDAIIEGMERQGFQVDGASDPSSALRLLAQSDYDVVLVDLILPDMNGLKLARKIRELFPDILTMLMSDYLLSPVQLAKANTGVVGFVPKPCRFDDIARFVKQKLEIRSSKGEVRSTTSSSSTSAKLPFDVLSVQYSF